MYLADVTRDAALELRHVVAAKTPTHAHLRDRLTAILVATAAVDAICGVLALLFEQGAKQSQIAGLASALFWTTTQLLTVSSSLQNPVTTGGRVLDVLMELYAITVVSTLAGSMGAFMVKRGREREREDERRRAVDRAERGGGA